MPLPVGDGAGTWLRYARGRSQGGRRRRLRHEALWEMKTRPVRGSGCDVMLAARTQGGMGGHAQRGQGGTIPGPKKVGPRAQFRTARRRPITSRPGMRAEAIPGVIARRRARAASPRSLLRACYDVGAARRARLAGWLCWLQQGEDVCVEGRYYAVAKTSATSRCCSASAPCRSSGGGNTLSDRVVKTCPIGGVSVMA